MKIVLPMAYKTKFFYRIYIQEEVYFREPVAMGVNDRSSLDRFIRPDYVAIRPREGMQVEPRSIRYPYNQGEGDA